MNPRPNDHLPQGAGAPFEERRSSRGTIVFAVFVAIALFFLLTEHRAHFFGALPYLLILACPLMHMFHHHGHGHGGHGSHAQKPQAGSSGSEQES